jgi:hypothetical protein
MPAGPVTDSSLVIAERFYQIAHSVKYQLGFMDVWYGDQNLIPQTPALVVEPGTKRRELSAAQDHTSNQIDTYFLIYHSPVSEMQNARRETIAVAEALERYLHRNHLRLFDAAVPANQLTIHGHNVELDPGYQFKGNTLYNAVQMTWRSITKTWLGR